MRLRLGSRLLFGVIAGLGVCAGAQAEKVILSTGEVLDVEILESTEEGVKVSHPVLGEVMIERDKLMIENPEGGSPLPPPPAIPPEPVSPWKFNFTLGGGLAQGNSDTANVTAIFNAVRETDNTRFAFDAGYWFSQDNGDNSENRFTAGLFWSWRIDESAWDVWADLRFDYDEFNSWEYRLTGHVGIGYEFIKNEVFTFHGRAGIGFIREWRSNNEDWRPEAVFGFDGEWKINEKSSIVFDSFYFPVVDNWIDDYRTTSSFGWKYLIDEDLNLALAFLLQHEYQNSIAVGRKHNDLRLTLGVDMSW